MSIEVGAKLPGKVSGITNFGAFIDLGEGKTGLVHISEVSNGFVKDIHDVLKVVGDDGKIGLSIRKAQEPAEGQQPKREFQRRENNYENRDRNPRAGGKKPFNKPQANNNNNKQDFDSLMSSFLKDSDDRLSSLKRNTEGKRGGRGGRRG